MLFRYHQFAGPPERMMPDYQRAFSLTLQGASVSLSKRSRCRPVCGRTGFRTASMLRMFYSSSIWTLFNLAGSRGLKANDVTQAILHTFCSKG